MPSSTVVILNYNGQSLLQKNLPSVITAASTARCQVVVVDNGSKDDSANYLRTNFRPVRLLELQKNFGYGEGNNQAVRLVKSDIVILLNNDVIPESDAFKQLIRHFEDSSIFAVSCRQIVKTGQGTFDGGLALPEFSRGLLRHQPGNVPAAQVVPQLYASGGAAAFNRKKFLALGGFDSLYAPFYWEDADLGVRAWARGWRVLYDPTSVVEHRHESTIKRIFPPWYVRAIAARNLFLFNWRHLAGWGYWFKHLAWLPVHILRRPLGFLFALPKIPAVIRRRLTDQSHFELTMIAD